jgi:hypothetical protein
LADNSAEIAKLETLRKMAARAVTNDGTTVTYDLAAAAKALREAQQRDDSQRGRRPVAPSIDLSGF